MTKQPNILILMVDQLNGLFFENGPADFLHAPNLRKLANQGVNFANTYCASPLCSPARASFMCGTLPSKNGVYDNAAELPSTLPTFAHNLRNLGYTTILSGKMHFVGADQLHGFEERLTTDIYPADFGWTPDWSKPEERVDWWYHNLASVTGAGVAATSNQLEFDDEVAYQAKLKLHQLARRDEKQPFCLTVSFTHPHDPYVARQKYWDLYPEGSIPPLSVESIPKEEQDAHSQRLYRAVDSQNFEINNQDINNARRAYCANISYLDEKVGEILEVLNDCQMGDETLIVFTADHGDMLGERGLWYKMSFFEGSMRVPMVFSAPWLTPRNESTPASVLDLSTTLVELAGGDVLPNTNSLAGRSLVDSLNGVPLPPAPVLAEYAAEGSVAPMVMIRDKQWKFNYCEADPHQLFNLIDDPLELTNLANSEEHQEVVRDFLDQVHEEWNINQFEQDVITSQRNRHLVYSGLRKGKFESWDWQPIHNAKERYMRNHLDLNEVEASARYPKAE